MYEGSRNTLDKFRDGCTELVGYIVTALCNLVTNRNQDIRTAFGKAQTRLTVGLKRSVVSSSATDGVPRKLTSTISIASQILSRILPATSNPGTGANCKRSTPMKSASWPSLAATPRAPPMASIARYRACVSVRLVERKRRTERVWVYPSARSMEIVRLRFELLRQIDAGTRVSSPSDLWPPTRPENMPGECERDGAREAVREEANGSWTGALIAGTRPSENMAGECERDGVREGG